MRRAAALSLVLVFSAACAKQAAPPSPSASPAESPSPAREQSPAVRRATASLVNHGPRAGRRVALTFDADMTEGMLAQLRSGEVSSWYNRAVVRELRATKTPVTIFLTGLWAKTYPRQVRSFARDPLFELANHSWDHTAFESGCFGLPSARSTARKRDEVTDAAREIERVAGEQPFYFRFPGGCHTTADLKLVASLGEQPVGWDVVSGDAFERDSGVIVDNVLEAVRPGSIVVMHLHGGPNAPATGDALREIIPALRDRGYEFVTLSELLG